MALGHFAVRGEELVALLEFHQENFADYLEGVIDGDLSRGEVIVD